MVAFLLTSTLPFQFDRSPGWTHGPCAICSLGLRRGTPQNAARDEFLVPAPKDVAVPFNAVQITNKNNNVFPRMGSCFAKIGSVRFCFRRTSMRKKRSTRTSCRHGREQSIPYLEGFGRGLCASAGRRV